MNALQTQITNPVAAACGTIDSTSLNRRELLRGAVMLSLCTAAGGLPAWAVQDRIVIRDGWVLLESDLP